MSIVNWQKCQGNIWGPLLTVNLSHSHFDDMGGVYVIWQAGGPVIRLGQGAIRDRLSAHRKDGSITKYGNLYVTWADVADKYRDGVERYLANVLKPIVGDAFPVAEPIPVNLPW